MARDSRVPSTKRSPRNQRGPRIFRRKDSPTFHAYFGEGDRVSLRTTDAGEAAALFAKLLTERKRSGPARSRAKETPLAQISAAYTKAPHGWTASTLETTKYRLAAYVEALGAMGVEYPSQVSSAVLNAWREDRMRTASRATVNRGETVAGSMHAWAAREGLSGASPFIGRTAIREPKRTTRRVVPTPAQVLAVAQWLADHKGLGASLAIRVGLSTGLRLDELRHLKLEHIGADGVRVVPDTGPASEAWTTKSFRERIIPVQKPVLELARTFVLWRTAERPNRIGRNATPRLTGCWMSKAIDRALEALNEDLDKDDQIKAFRAHDLRRLFVTVSVRGGIPLDVVQRWVGHKDTKTTQGYLVTLVSDGAMVAPMSF